MGKLLSQKDIIDYENQILTIDDLRLKYFKDELKVSNYNIKGQEEFLFLLVLFFFHLKILSLYYLTAVGCRECYFMHNETDYFT